MFCYLDYSLDNNTGYIGNLKECRGAGGRGAARAICVNVMIE